MRIVQRGGSHGIRDANGIRFTGKTLWKTKEEVGTTRNRGGIEDHNG